MAKYTVEISSKPYTSDEINVRRYVVKHNNSFRPRGRSEVEAYVADVVNKLSEENEDRATYNYTILDYKKPKVLDLDGLKKAMRCDWL